MRFLGHAVCAALLSAMAIAGFTGGPAAAQPGAAGDDRVHYSQGSYRATLVLAYDELYTTPAPEAGGARAPVTSALPGATTQPTGERGAALVRLGTAAASRSELAQRAATLNAAGHEARAVAYHPGAPRTPETRFVITNRLAVGLADPAALQAILANHAVRLVEKLDLSGDIYVLETTGGGLLAAVDTANALGSRDGVAYAEPLFLHRMAKRLVPNDTHYPLQWHLNNTGSHSGISGEVAGNDINAQDAWDSVTGDGVNIAIVDDGVETTHEDLAANARTDIDIDINGGDNDPTPLAAHPHGTACAGVAAAVGNNNLGVTGAAFEAGIVGIRLIAAAFSSDDIAEAMSHQMAPANAADRVHINSNSWGPSDNGSTLAGPDSTALAGITDAIAQGRGGLGTIFVWAGGNGKSNGDNANKDGYANSRYTIAVGASGANGVQSNYSEDGACILINAPSNYSGGAITTVDMTGSNGYNGGPSGDNNYTQSFGGTSSACPLAAGAIALILEANPNLTWRDVQHVLVETSTQNDAADPDWQTNGAGFEFNHKYGFGRIDADAAADAAATWTNVPAEVAPLTNTESPGLAIPDANATGITRTLSLSTPDALLVEHVLVTVDIAHTARGNLNIELTSPDGTVSRLAEISNDGNNDFADWTFMTVANWGEDPAGDWQLKVADLTGGDTGTLNSWTLTAHVYPDPTADQPVLNVTPDTRNAGSGAGNTTFDVANTGVDPLNWNAAVTQGGAWLNITSGASGTDAGTINVQFLANPTNTSRTGQITVTATGAAGSPKVVEVVQEGLPLLSVTPSSRSVAAAGGATSFNVANAGDGSLTYSAQVTSGNAWLNITSGASGGNSGAIAVSAQANPGTTPRSGTIEVSSPEATNSPVSVTVNQAGRARLDVSPLSVNFSSSADQQLVAVANTGDGSMPFQAAVTSGAGWLSVAPGTGSAPMDVTISVTENANVAPRSGTVQITATGALDSPQQIDVTQSGCVISSAPANVAASDGTFADRVRITWNTVPGANQYWVYRGESGTQSTAQAVVIAVTTSTTYEDLSAANGAGGAPPTAGCGGTGGGGGTTSYNYAVSAVGPCGEGPASAFDAGFASAAKSLDPVAEMALPATGPAPTDAAIALRVFADAPVDPASVWATVNGEPVEAAWIPSASGLTGWVRYTPSAPWHANAAVEMAAGVATVAGHATPPVSAVFQIGSDPAQDGAIATRAGAPEAVLNEIDAGTLPAHPMGVGPVYQMAPETAYDGPRDAWVPVPGGVHVETARVQYYAATADTPGWYPVDQVQGLLASEPIVAAIEGEVWIRLSVNHGGAIQVAAQPAQSEAALMPGTTAGGLGLLFVVVLVLSAASRIHTPRRG